MKLVIILIEIILSQTTFAQNYGYLFTTNDNYIQTIYSLLCNESTIKLELFINRTTGVIFYGENKIIDSSVLVYFKRPGIYLNVTTGNLKFTLPFMLDFFNNEWIGWHDLEIIITKSRLGLSFDGILREAMLNDRYIFPENDIEDNIIYFGKQYRDSNFLIPGFHGYMRNMQFTSCGCDKWRPVKIVDSQGISFNHLGECNTDSSCGKGCSCLLFPWGKKKCDCSGVECNTADHDIFYGFDNKISKWLNDRRQLKIISGSDNIQNGVGIFGDSLRLDESNQWVVLVSQHSKTCFKNIFYCESEIFYQFWILPLIFDKLESNVRILKHSSSIQSIYGLDVFRTGKNYQFILVTNSNRKYKIEISLPTMKWNRITINFNQTHLKLYLNSHLISSINQYASINQPKPKLINTKYLSIGDKDKNSFVEIDEFKFSTNNNILYEPSLQEYRLEQHQSILQAHPDCVINQYSDLINITHCYSDQFKLSNYSFGFYFSIIFQLEQNSDNILLIKSSLFDLSVHFPNLLKINLKNNVTKSINLRKSINDLYYLELSMNSRFQLSIIQSIDYLLDTIDFDYSALIGFNKPLHLYINYKSKMLKEITFLNFNKTLATRALRLVTSKLTHYSADFDHLDSNVYLPIELTKGFVGSGVRLRYPQNYISLDVYKSSCIRNIETCHSGVLIVFRMKLETFVSINNREFMTIFNSGKSGLSLLLDKSFTFLLIINGKIHGKYMSDKLRLLKNDWWLIELSISANRFISLHINDIEYQYGKHEIQYQIYDCSGICFGEYSQPNNSFVFIVDEINIWDADRTFLYANEFISIKNTRHKLYSFTSFQLGKDFTMEGSAKLISTKYGQGISLNGFGPRFASTNMTNISNFFTVIDECRRGILVRIWIRIDNLAINQHVFISSPQFIVGSNLGSLFVRLSTLDKVWYFISKDILNVFTWQSIVISWRRDNGLKVYLNGEFIGHVITGTDESHKYSYFKDNMYFGKEHLKSSEDYATVLIDDVEFFEADLSNLAYEVKDLKNISCSFKHSFDQVKRSRAHMQLGVIGNAGIFYSNTTVTERSISIPQCFYKNICGCDGCFALRFWMSVNHLNIGILEVGNLKLFVSTNNFSLHIIDESRLIHRIFICKYNNKDLLRNWYFIEISWHSDEGLLMFINRELLTCDNLKNGNTIQKFSKSLQILDSFVGSIDELEIYKSRLSILYWKNIVDENKIEYLLQKLQYKIKLQKDMAMMTKNSRQGKSNFTVQYIQSFEFNGSNYLEYKMPIFKEMPIMGAKEEIEVSFKSLDNIVNSVIWISDGSQSKSILSLKNGKLYFTKIYITPTVNGTKRVSEEFEIYQNIKPNIVYNLLIYQKSGQFVMKITSIYETSTQSMIGRESLLPINSNIYFGGFTNQQGIEFNSTNSSFVGIIYKAKIKSVFDKQAVDIIQEMAEVRSNRNIINHGNVKVVMKSTETVLPSKASFLGTIIDRKMPLMIINHFTSVILPKWDFELIVSFEIEFSTYESQGLLIFIGNASHFIAFELFDSQIYFVYKFNGLWKRVGIDERNHVFNDNHFHNVYLGRDLSGNIKVFIDKKETINNLYIPTEFYNSSTIIGFYGSFQSMPPEILSKSSFIGCIHFVGINDEGFLNFTRWTPFINKPKELFGLLKQITEPFMIDSCLSPKKSTCDSSPCKPGWCKLTSISSIGQPFNNFKCNCLYSSKTLSNKFTGSSAIENYNIWIKRNMLESRSETCTADVTQILIIENNYFKLNLNIAHPFLSVIDLEFMILMKSANSCIVKISDIEKSINIELILIDGLLFLTMTKNFHFTVPNITISDGQWHGVNLRVRPGMVQLKINNIEKVLDSSVFSLANFSTLIFGHCTSLNQSHFRIKNLLFNYLNPLENMSFFSGVPVNNLFYKTDYIYPHPGISVKGKQHNLLYPVTFLNNFRNAITNSSIKLSWINEIEIEMKIQHPGLLAHIVNKDKFISIIVCSVNHIVIVYKDGYLKSERLDVRISNETLKMKIIIDLIKAVIEYENVLLKQTYQIAKHLYSWHIGDDMWIEFGINKNNFKYILSENLNFNHDKCLHELANKTVIGCLHTFLVSNNKYILNINERWNTDMQVSPATSVLAGRCLDVKICQPDSCENGECRTANFTEIFCDCSSTPFTGDRCHLPKPQCVTNSCKNNGKCISGLVSFTCNCKGTGYTGRYCQESLCNSIDCFNNGLCRIVDNYAQCNCLNTGFTGQYCENSLCDSHTCNNQGICRLDEKLKTPICECNFGYFGDSCEINGTAKCENGCLNGGVCTLFSPAMKLCSNSYCQLHDKLFDCNCDNTIFNGRFCEQREFGFNPSVDGVIEMKKIKLEKYNYMRILMEPISQNKKMSLLHVTFSKKYYLMLIMDQARLWLRIHSKYNRNEEKFSLGLIKPVNVLMLSESATLISYVFNSEFGNISLSNEFPNLFRSRRSSSNNQMDNYPDLILGSDSNGNDKFDGLIAGFQWNGRDMMNENNIVRKSEKSFPIKSLKIKVFPRQNPYLLLPKSFSISLILVIIILIIMALFYCFRKPNKLIRSQDLRNGDFIPLFSNIKNSDENIIETETEIIPDYSQNTMNTDSSHYQISNKLIIISDISSLSNLRIMDILILNDGYKCAVVVRNDQSLNAKKVFPSNECDNKYNCLSISATSNLRFAYSHMKLIDSINDDIVELQVWKIQDDWSRVCSPPNIKFTHSIAKPGNSTELILFNRHFLTVFIWLLDFSDVIWQTTITPTIDSSFHSLSISQDSRYLFFNNKHVFYSVDLLENPSFLNIIDSNIHNIGILEQILSIQNDDLLIRTNNNDLYIYNASTQLFRRILQSHKVILVTKFEHGEHVKWALGLDSGEIYLTNDLENNLYHILGPRNKTPIRIISFSSDASLMCAGFDKSLVHLWKIKPDISVCRFYAFHMNILFTQLYFTADNRFMLASFPSSDNESESVLLTSSRI